MHIQNPSPDPSRWTPGARLVLAAGLFLIVGGLAQLAYRFTLPTLGWSVYTIEVDDSDLYFAENLVGASSALQPEDALVEVAGVPGRAFTGLQLVPPPAGWEAGGSVEMQIRRCENPYEATGCRDISMVAPVVQWTLSAVWEKMRIESALPELFGVFALLLVSWYTFLQRPDVLSARSLLIFCSAYAAAVISSLLPADISVSYDPFALIFTGFFTFVIFGTVIGPAILTFSLSFPRPKKIIDRYPILIALPHLAGLLLLAFLLAGGPGSAGWLMTLGMLILSIASLLHAGLTEKSPAGRAQIRWALLGFFGGLLLFVLNIPIGLGWIQDPVFVRFGSFLANFGLPLIGIGLAVAILRYRLYDIDVIIRRTLQYTLLSALLAITFFGGVIVFQELFRSFSGNQESPLVTVLSTLMIAALFNPLRSRVQEFVDRRFYRVKYSAEQTLLRFASAARDEVDMDRLITTLLSAVEETMQPDQTSIWIVNYE